MINFLVAVMGTCHMKSRKGTVLIATGALFSLQLQLQLQQTVTIIMNTDVASMIVHALLAVTWAWLVL